MGNLNTKAQKWLEELFAYEYCSECGGDADDHTAVPFNGNWFARCSHPMLTEELSEKQIEDILKTRRERQEAGLPMVAGCK